MDHPNAKHNRNSPSYTRESSAPLRVSPFRAAVFYLPLAILVVGCGRKAPKLPELEKSSQVIDIHWPPADPEETNVLREKPLLQAVVEFKEPKSDSPEELSLRVIVKRPSAEADRKYWNSKLAYADLGWMENVRVWDKDEQWLWPNLTFLLSRHGKERVERYGGVDPGKGVDNDFGAVLIRQYDQAGKVELPHSKKAPLVSAKWHPRDAESIDGQSIVHQVTTDYFSVPPGKRPSGGKIKLWLIYADFLGSRAPEGWPKEPEWAGGILAYCEIEWQLADNKSLLGQIQHRRPTARTSFDWETWSTTGGAKSKLAAD